MAFTTNVIPSGAGTITRENIGSTMASFTATPSNRKYYFKYWLVDDNPIEYPDNPYITEVSGNHVLTAYFGMIDQPLSLYDDKQGHVGVCFGSLALDARDKVISELDTILRNTEFRQGSNVTVVDDSDPDNIQTITKPAYKIFSTDAEYVSYTSDDTIYASNIRTMSGSDYGNLATKDEHTLYFLTSKPSQ